MSALVPKGAPIAVIAPCSAYNEARFEQGLALLREAGHAPHPLPGLLAPHRYLAADDETRLGQLIEALTDPRWAAVWIARGGYGLTRLLDRLNLAAVSRPVIGFSDVTALFNAMDVAGAQRAIHGPVVHSLGITDEASLDHLWRLLDGAPTEPLPGEVWREGDVTAPLVGGNLCMLASTAGTAQQLDARGCILLLEEIGEYAYRVDRALQQLRSSSQLEGLAGVALGEFRDCHVPEGVSWTVDDILREHLEPLGVPILAGLPIGHGPANRAFVVGKPARLSGNTLTLDP